MSEMVLALVCIISIQHILLDYIPEYVIGVTYYLWKFYISENDNAILIWYKGVISFITYVLSNNCIW